MASPSSVIAAPASASASATASAAAASGVTPWYRQAWPWLLMLMPTIALVGGLYTAFLAYTTNNSLVVDDYYKEGKAINLDIARDRKAVEMGLQAVLAMEGDGLALRLTGKDGVPMPAAVSLKIMHATRAERDIAGQLLRGPDGVYRLPGVSLPADGHWRLQLDDASRVWRLVTTTAQLREPVEFGATRP